MIGLFPIVVEGAIDRCIGRARETNPYNFVDARDHWEAWAWGWDDADYLISVRGRGEVTRWSPEHFAECSCSLRSEWHADLTAGTGGPAGGAG